METEVPPSSYEISDYQTEAISDGEITREEYDIGFKNFQACMENIGFPIHEVKEINLQYEYWYDVEADKHGADDCFFFEFAKIQGGWVMRPEVAELTPDSQGIRQCLIDRGIEPAETHVERVDQLAENKISIGDCPT